MTCIIFLGKTTTPYVQPDTRAPLPTGTPCNSTIIKNGVKNPKNTKFNRPVDGLYDEAVSIWLRSTLVERTGGMDRRLWLGKTREVHLCKYEM